MTADETTTNGSVGRWMADVLGPAGVGAGVTVLTSLIPFVGLLAPAIGGGVASRVGTSENNGPQAGLLAGGLVVLLSLPVTFFAVAATATVSPAATFGVLGATLIGAAYVLGSSALGGYLADSFTPGSTTRANGTRDVTSATDPVREPPVERLKRRYVEGEIDDAEFERRLERLVAAEEATGSEGAVAAENRTVRSPSRENTTAARER